jgi:hypothetical protein
MKNKQKEWHHATKPYNFWGSSFYYAGIVVIFFLMLGAVPHPGTR